nr:coiled-coil domain-containing protein 189-like [Physcomitrium patens]|eukprot:XP_024398972.1 coiled-coil domain-containing protein 189-like [Physcomitrella patens]
MVGITAVAIKYFRHYKMYQYAFMPTFILNIETLETSNFVEVAPLVRALKGALTQDEKDVEDEQVKKRDEEEMARIAEEERITMEEERQREINAAYLAAIPADITQKVNDALTKRLEILKKDLDEQIHAIEDKVIQKMTTTNAGRPSQISQPPPGSQPQHKAKASKGLSTKKP